MVVALKSKVVPKNKNKTNNNNKGRGGEAETGGRKKIKGFAWNQYSVCWYHFGEKPTLS